MPGPDFSKVLKDARKANGWTQDELAERAGTSKQVVSRYERGERSPKLGDAQKLMNALGLDFDRLAAGNAQTRGGDARKIFADNLNELLDRRGLSQVDVAVKLNVTTAAVSTWCSGKKYPRVDAMQKLASLLGVTMSALTSREGMKDVDDMDRLEAMHQNPRLQLLFDYQRQMSGRDVELMLEIVERMMKT